jgi:drug/metabolite transporter (DMT)-like permease
VKTIVAPASRARRTTSAMTGMAARASAPYSAPRSCAKSFCMSTTIWALAYLVTFGSVGLFASTLAVIRRWTVTASSYAVVLMPVATLGLEALLAGVPITGSAVLGAALVAVGVWVGALAPVRVGTVAAEPVGR